MQIKQFDKIDNESKRSIGITIGNFDGVHLGHRKQLKEFVETCKKKSITPTLISYEIHPAFSINPDLKSYIITTNQQRNMKLKELGIQKIFEIKFSDSIRSTTGKDFIDKLLNLDCISLLCVGPDFTLGSNKEDMSEYSRKCCLDKEIKFIQGDKFTLDGVRVSSTKIRQLLKGGDIEKVNEYLGRTHSIIDKVVNGKGKGQSIGFATANIRPRPKLVYPSIGVYAGWTKLNNQKYRCAINIGLAPTLGGLKEIAIETHILGFEENLYGQELEIFIVQKIRDEIKFNTIEDLRTQITEDIKVAKAIRID